jgi:hypothetical protein
MIALFNMLCPFKWESFFSLVPFGAKPAARAIGGFAGLAAAPGNVAILSGSSSASSWLALASRVWLAGFALILLHGVIASIRLSGKISTAVRAEGNIYETDRIDAPFVFGFFRPRIYMPKGVAEPARKHIIAHERMHIKRKDYLVSAIAYFAQALHWFNPLAWLAGFLLLRDIESSCDEAVLASAGEDIRGEYSEALLSVAARSCGLAAPLAFGEQSVKWRIKNALSYKKSPRIMATASAAAVLALAVGFSAFRKEAAPKEAIYDGIIFATEKEAYHPEFDKITAVLASESSDRAFFVGDTFTLEKKGALGWSEVRVWRGYYPLGYLLKQGSPKTYELRQENVEGTLKDGLYRIRATGSEEAAADSTKAAFCAEFRIDSSIGKPEVATLEKEAVFEVDAAEYASRGVGPYLDFNAPGKRKTPVYVIAGVHETGTQVWSAKIDEDGSIKAVIRQSKDSGQAIETPVNERAKLGDFLEDGEKFEEWALSLE